MARKVKETILPEVKEALASGKLIMGTERVIKNLKLGKVLKVFLSSNCSAEIKEKIEYYTKISAIKTVDLKYPNDELGTLCKKPFSISVLAVGA